MHSALRKELENLKSLSQEEGSPLAIIETKMENAVFVSNGEKLVCLVVEETKIHNVLTCFKVNLKKWEWAADEGFTMEDGIPKELADEILIKFQTPSEYLGYLGF
jgi:hypothetical protein